MVISELLQKSIQLLNKSGCDNSRFEAMQLIGFVLNCKVSDLVLNAKKEISAELEDEIMRLLKRRISGEPLQYILGTQEFMGLEFDVSPDVLIPRQDTETLVEFILDRFKNTPATVLDIGTGTGCIPISLAYFKSAFKCLGIDISDDAVKTAKKNADALSVSDRVHFEKCDILADFPKGKFDIVLSNPPYIKSSIIGTLQKEVRDFEPILALDGGQDGLKFYRRICSIAPEILKKGGLLALEIGYDQASAVTELMEKEFCNVNIIKDLSGNDRVVFGNIK